MRGRKSLFKDHMIIEGEKLARLGFTVEEIADFWNVSSRSLYRWLNKYPEFCHTLKIAKQEADKRIEKKLFQRAEGYEYIEETHEKRGVGLILTKKVVKQMAPDTTAQIFWLKNRQPDKWRDKKDLDHSGEVKVDNKLTIEVVSVSDNDEDTGK